MFPHEIAGLRADSTSLIPNRGHAVQFYETDQALINALCQQLAPSLVAGDTALLVATESHLKGLELTLASRGFDISAARASHRYIELDAADTLQKLMVQGWPDPNRFNAVVGQLISRAKALSDQRRVLVYGEMVALLWQEGRHEATLRLEQIWNDYLERHAFFLICGYPLDMFSRAAHRQMFFNICGEHTHVNATDGDRQKVSGQQQRNLAALHKKARTLENEIRLSQERTLLLQSNTQGGTWELDLGSNCFSLSSAAARLLGIGSGSAGLSSILGQMYYSGDREALSTVLEQTRKGRRNFAVRFRVWNGETVRMLEMRGKVFCTAAAPMMLGVLLDVTPAITAVA